MAVKVSASITLTVVRDIQAVYWFYKLQSSTSAAPAKPTAINTLPPSGWTDTEPGYDSTQTKSLYRVELTVYTDGTFDYSPVWLESSYEAAKQAYNRAVAANNAATAAQGAVEQAQEVIHGTQTAATGAWTGTSTTLSAIMDGTTITYWLPFAGSGNATLNLTLKSGTATGAKPLYYGGTTRLNTQYPAGSVIRLTYRENVAIGTGTYTGWWADANYDSGNTYDRQRYNQAVKAGSTAIVAANIIVAGANNAGTYTHLKLGNPFDITYPILYAESAIAAGGTGTNNYLSIPLAIATTQNLTLTAYKPVYIKGRLSGRNFTPDGTAPLTQTVPTAADENQYILLGTAYSATSMYLLQEHPIYQYYKGGFKRSDEILWDVFTDSKDYSDGQLQQATTSISQAMGQISLAVEGKVGAADVISKINQSAEEVKINAARVNLSAYATSQQLQTETAGIYALYTPYTQTSSTASFSAVIYQRGADVTDTVAAGRICWYRKNEDTGGLVSLGTGKTKSVSLSQIGYGGTVTAQFSLGDQVPLLCEDGAELFCENGTTLDTEAYDGAVIQVETALYKQGALKEKFATIRADQDDILLEVGRKVGNDEIISRINMSPEEIKLAGSKIGLEGAISANGTFSVDVDGNIHATGGTIGGFTLEADKLLHQSANGELRFSGDQIRSSGTHGSGSQMRTVIEGGRLAFYRGSVLCGYMEIGSGTDSPQRSFSLFGNGSGEAGQEVLNISSNAANLMTILVCNDAQNNSYIDHYGNARFATLNVTGTKSRVALTENYGSRELYSYETASPMFGDIGEGVVGVDGECYIRIDPALAECIDSQYQVFLQAYGAGTVYVQSRSSTYFVVAGTPGLAFGWEMKAKQKGFEAVRLRQEVETPDMSDSYQINTVIATDEETGETYVYETVEEVEHLEIPRCGDETVDSIWYKGPDGDRVIAEYTYVDDNS